MNKDTEHQIQRNEAERKLRDADALILAARFPNMSRSCRAANISHEIPSGASVAGNREGKASAATASSAAPGNRAGGGGKLVLRLVGQVRGGKNAMGVTKTGKHYARTAFKKWRADMASQIRAQLPPYAPIVEPCKLRIDYVAGDGKRRDQTGIFDALFHLLEHTRVILDDSLLWVTESTKSYDKKSPGVTITFLNP